MPGPRRCFATAKALQRLEAVLLCEVLMKFPEYLKERSLQLPAKPTQDNLDYEAIRAACMSGDMPADLDDVLSMVSIMGTTAGWERIQEEARAQKKKLDFAVINLTNADLAMKAWLLDWPKNKNLLEESYSRQRIHARSSYFYFPPLRDVRHKYKLPSDAGMDELKQDLAGYFVVEGLGKGSNIVRFDCEKEVWFLIRYPGRLKRQVTIDEDGEAANLSFKPEEYDAVVYHKVYGDLRVNTSRKRDRKKYRILFGHALLASENLFAPNADVITLEPLKGPCLGLFNCDDINGLAEIAPIEISFRRITKSGIGREFIWRADKNTTLLDSNTLAPFLLPEDTDTVQYAIFHYRLRNRTKFASLTVHQGNSMTYDRDGDSVVLEEWLRTRKFVKDMLAPAAGVHRVNVAAVA